VFDLTGGDDDLPTLAIVGRPRISKTTNSAVPSRRKCVRVL
jgi:hypothetical protein